MEERQIQQLIREAQAGESGSRETVLTAHRDWAESLARQGRSLRAGEPAGDESSVALLALNEAIDTFRPGAGSFRGYAYRVIQNRLRDYYRSERRHRHLSLDAPTGEEGEEAATVHPAEAAEAWSRHQEAEEARDRAEELAEYRDALAIFGIDLGRMAELAPRHGDTRAALVAAARTLAADPELREELLRRRRLPLHRLAGRVPLSPKTLKKWRPFLVAVAVVFLHPEWELLNEFFRPGADAAAGAAAGPGSRPGAHTGGEDGKGGVR